MARELFEVADKDGDQKLNKEEVRKFLKTNQIDISKKEFNDRFDAFDIDKNGTIDQKEFIILMQNLQRKEELLPVFTKYAKEYNGKDDEPVMSISELIQFYKYEQATDLSQDQAKEFFELLKKVSVSGNPQNQRIEKISFHDFGTLIFSDWNSAFNPQHRQVHMVRILPHFQKLTLI